MGPLLCFTQVSVPVADSASGRGSTAKTLPSCRKRKGTQHVGLAHLESIFNLLQVALLERNGILTRAVPTRAQQACDQKFQVARGAFVPAHSRSNRATTWRNHWTTASSNRA